MSPGRFLLCCLIGTVLSHPRPSLATSEAGLVPPDPLSGVDIVREANAKATYYFPQIDDWPRPNVMIYPIVAASDSGARTMILRVVLKDPPYSLKRSFRLMIDGTPVNLPLDEKGAVTEDNSGCRSNSQITLGRQESVVKRIAAAKQVEVWSGGYNQRPYILTDQDFDRARRILTLFESGTLPPAPGDDSNPPPGVKPPELIPGSKVQPRFPPEALQKRNKIQAKVTLEATIGVDGTIGKIRVSKSAGGDCGFEEASLAAVKQWRYKPATKNGKPVEMSMKVVVEFYSRL